MTAGLQIGQANFNDEFYVTDFVLYMSCEDGYMIDDPQLSAISCNEDGDWNSTFPTCLKSFFIIMTLILQIFRTFKFIYTYV